MSDAETMREAADISHRYRAALLATASLHGLWGPTGAAILRSDLDRVADALASDGWTPPSDYRERVQAARELMRAEVEALDEQAQRMGAETP